MLFSIGEQFEIHRYHVDLYVGLICISRIKFLIALFSLAVRASPLFRGGPSRVSIHVVAGFIPERSSQYSKKDFGGSHSAN